MSGRLNWEACVRWITAGRSWYWETKWEHRGKVQQRKNETVNHGWWQQKSKKRTDSRNAGRKNGQSLATKQPGRRALGGRNSLWHSRYAISPGSSWAFVQWPVGVTELSALFLLRNKERGAVAHLLCKLTPITYHMGKPWPWHRVSGVIWLCWHSRGPMLKGDALWPSGYCELLECSACRGRENSPKNWEGNIFFSRKCHGSILHGQ